MRVPTGWFARQNVAAGMSVPRSLAFASSEYVPEQEPSSWDWADLVEGSLSPRGAAIALLAYDRSVPASSWLRGEAARVLREAGVDLSTASPSGRGLARGVRIADLVTLDPRQTGDVLPLAGWFQAGQFEVGVYVWLGVRSDRGRVMAVVESIRLEE
jgi:hypothetical protein